MNKIAANEIDVIRALEDNSVGISWRDMVYRMVADMPTSTIGVFNTLVNVAEHAETPLHFCYDIDNYSGWRAFARDDNKISAIKALKEYHNKPYPDFDDPRRMGLKEAKDIVEAYIDWYTN